jgi:hypothetical protein
MDTYTFYPEYPQTDNASVHDIFVKINSQLALYKNKKGITGRPSVLLSVKSMPPICGGIKMAQPSRSCR